MTTNNTNTIRLHRVLHAQLLAKLVEPAFPIRCKTSHGSHGLDPDLIRVIRGLAS
jgi:hypothetical protein